MDILWGMIGIFFLWMAGTGLSIIGICVVLAIYASIKKIDANELMDSIGFKTYSKYAFIIGAIFALAVLAKRGGFL